jgi:hypothetical protein
VSDVGRANPAALAAPTEPCSGMIYNVSGGKRSSLLQVLAVLEQLVGVAWKRVTFRPGPVIVRHSEADIRAAGRDLGYRRGFHAAVSEKRLRGSFRFASDPVISYQFFSDPPKENSVEGEWAVAVVTVTTKPAKGDVDPFSAVSARESSRCPFPAWKWRLAGSRKVG